MRELEERETMLVNGGSSFRLALEDILSAAMGRGSIDQTKIEEAYQFPVEPRSNPN